MQTHTIRSTGSLAVWTIGAVLALVALVDLALGDARAFGHAAGPILLVVWALGIVLARPVIRYGDAGLVVVNPLVVREIGWGAVDDVARRMQIELALGDGSRVVAWASPAVSRRRRTDQTPADDPALAELRTAWEQARLGRSAGAVRRRPDLPVVVTGVVLVAATVAGLLL